MASSQVENCLSVPCVHLVFNWFKNILNFILRYKLSIAIDREGVEGKSHDLF